MSDGRTVVAFSATEAFFKHADEYSRRLGMPRATFIATVIEFALKDDEFFEDAFMARVSREIGLALHGGDEISVGKRSKSIQILLKKKELKEIDRRAKRMKKSRSEVVATVAEEGFESNRLAMDLAKQPMFRRFVQFLKERKAFVDVLPQC